MSAQSLRRFLDERKASWDALETLLRRIHKDGIKSLPEDELLELSRLYRKTTSDLAHAQAFVRDAQTTRYLNDLVGRAHGVVYRTRGAALARMGRFLSVGYPRLVRKHIRYVAAAAVLLFGSGFFGFSVVQWDYESRAAVIPAQMAPIEATLEEREHWADIDSNAAPQVSSQILVNNIRVSLLAFALGVFAGIGTVLVLLMNGITLGGVFGLAAHHGVLGVLLTFVVSHGVIELTCICIAGGAGLLMGSAVWMPGERSIRDALIERGRDAVLLMLGTAPLLVLAGIIEGFVSPLKTPAWVQLTFAVVPATFLVWYLLRGREPRSM